MPPLKSSSSNLTLTYDALDILGENDKSLFLHKRPLLNADTMVKKGHFKSALEIYYRAAGKITKPEILQKIQKNISDIHAYLKNTDPDSEKAFLEKYSDNREKEFTESLKELTENLSDSLAEKLNILKQIETVPERETPKTDPGKTPAPDKGEDSEIKPLDLGSLDTKPKQEKKSEEKSTPEEPEEIEGTLEYEKDSSEEPKDQESKKEKKSKKANIKVKKEPDSEIKSDSTEIKSGSTDVKSDSTEVKSDSTDVKSDKTQIENQSAEFSGDTKIQNANLESDSIQVGNQNISNVQPSTTVPQTTEENKTLKSDDFIPDANFENKKESSSLGESKVVEEVRIVKEYKDVVDSPPNLSKESKLQNREELKTQEITSSSKHISQIEEADQLLLPLAPKTKDIETGWEELESEPPKPKADKDYAPSMKKYEVGNIEIPESTEFITGEFVSRESNEEIQPDQETNEKSKGKKSSHSGFSSKPNLTGGFEPSIPSPFDQSSSSSFPISNENQENKSISFDDGGQQAFNPPPLPPPLPLNINDWLSNLYFSKEWEKFKPLPMKERRSGKDRRVSTSGELPKGVKKNRRSGKDRRRQDANLLQERENFLKDWNKENQNFTPSLSNILGNTSLPGNLPSSESGQFFSPDIDPNLKTLEFLPRDPSSQEKLPSSDELIKVELPDPEEITLKPPLDQNEVKKEEVAGNIAESLSKYVPANEELGLPESDKGLVKIDLPDPILMKAETNELPQREVSGEIEVSSKDGTGIVSESKSGPANRETSKDGLGGGKFPYTPEDYQIPDELKIELPDPDDYVRTKSGHLIDPFAPEETPEINMIEGDGPLPSEEEGAQISDIPELPPPPPEPERTIHGILELKPPEIDDAPFLTLTYDFSKIPHPFKLSKNYSIMEYSYYKYKPMLMKAQEFARRKMLKNALNYYRVIKSQNIPPELKNMINRNITDITEFLEKFIMSKGG